MRVYILFAQFIIRAMLIIQINIKNPFMEELFALRNDITISIPILIQTKHNKYNIVFFVRDGDTLIK